MNQTTQNPPYAHWSRARKGGLLFCLLLCACQQSGDHAAACASAVTPAEPPQYKARLITFGDSQTAGCVSAVNGVKYSWAFQMSQDLNLGLINTAVSGSLFTQGDEAGIALALKQAYLPTDTIGMLIGYNDMRAYGLNGEHIEQFEADLTAVLSAVSPQVSQIIIGSCLHPYLYDDASSPQAVTLYRDATRAVVAALALPNVTVIDVDGSFEGQEPAYLPDGIHLTPTSQDTVAHVFEGALTWHDVRVRHWPHSYEYYEVRKTA